MSIKTWTSPNTFRDDVAGRRGNALVNRLQNLVLSRFPHASHRREPRNKMIDPQLPLRYVVRKDVDQSAGLLDDWRNEQPDQAAEGNDGSDDGEKELRVVPEHGRVSRENREPRPGTARGLLL
jgi:hypothetical protein